MENQICGGNSYVERKLKLAFLDIGVLNSTNLSVVKAQAYLYVYGHVCIYNCANVTHVVCHNSLYPLSVGLWVRTQARREICVKPLNLNLAKVAIVQCLAEGTQSYSQHWTCMVGLFRVFFFSLKEKARHCWTALPFCYQWLAWSIALSETDHQYFSSAQLFLLHSLTCLLLIPKPQLHIKAEVSNIQPDLAPEAVPAGVLGCWWATRHWGRGLL